jgi:DNA-binding transcriptional regulator YhcF (GntR family)
LLATVEGDRALEVGLVGREGVAGVASALGVDVSSARALVQVSGTALRMKAARFQKALGQCLPLQRELYRYTYAKLAMARQTVACNCFHAVEARLARWLLMTSDRVRSEEFFLTQAFLARMLGVRRATVNEAARPLQQRELISHSRGKITYSTGRASKEPRVGVTRRSTVARKRGQAIEVLNKYCSRWENKIPQRDVRGVFGSAPASRTACTLCRASAGPGAARAEGKP